MARIPEKVGKYKIISVIGKGGMGMVYAAEHPSLKRKVILKKLTIKDKEFRERFRLEADIMMDLRSDYIVDMYDHFREGSSWYIAMEFIEGITLDQLIRKKGSLGGDLLVYVMSCTARALEYIHKRGIIHRDIKPSNIYLSRSGDVKLGDFGIASSASRNVKITDSGSAMGTPAYMAPEQFADSSSVDSRADIFSFGVTLYESLTGVKPFNSEEYTDLKKEICRGKYRHINREGKNIPVYLRWMIRRALSVNRSFRQKDISSIRRRFDRELKNPEYNEVKQRLADQINTDSRKKKQVLTRMESVPEKREKKSFYKILSAALAISATVFFIYSGGIYKIILPRTFGGLQLSIIPSVEEGKYAVYSESPELEKPVDSGFFNNKGKTDLYLKEGSYRIKIETGSLINWRTVYVPAFSDNDGKKMEMIFLSSSLEQFPVHLDYSVKNRFTGEDLTENTKVFIRRDKDWELLSENIRSSLKSGIEFALKFSHSSYGTAVYYVNTETYQTAVDLDVLLSPEAALLQIHPYKKGVLKINNREQYFSLDTLKFEDLPGGGEKTTTLNLLPGRYIVTLDRENDPVEEEITLTGGKEYNFSFEN